MLETEQANCAICGKEFTRECKRGRRVAFCSEECRKKQHKRHSNTYNRKRFAEDADWRAHKRELNNNSAKLRRAMRKDVAWSNLAFDVRKAKDIDEATEILKNRTRLKSENYA